MAFMPLKFTEKGVRKEFQTVIDRREGRMDCDDTLDSSFRKLMRGAEDLFFETWDEITADDHSVKFEAFSR